MVKELQARPFVFEELLEAQKARNELMKWKLIIVAAIGSAGLGIIKTDGLSKFYIILLLIPIVCVYVDLLCRNLSIRAMKINMFSSTYKDATSFDIEYHRFYQTLKKANSGMSLESIALIWSTVLLTIIIIGLGFLIPTIAGDKWVFLITGIVCLGLSMLVERRYRFEKRVILFSQKSNSSEDHSSRPMNESH